MCISFPLRSVFVSFFSSYPPRGHQPHTRKFRAHEAKSSSQFFLQGRVSGSQKNVVKPCAEAAIFSLRFLNSTGILYGRLDFQTASNNPSVLPKSLHVSWSHSSNGIYFPIRGDLPKPIPLCQYHFPAQSGLEHRRLMTSNRLLSLSTRFPRMVFAYQSLRVSSGANRSCGVSQGIINRIKRLPYSPASVPPSSPLPGAGICTVC